MSIRIALIEDNESTRRGWRQVLGEAPGYACVAEFGSAEEAEQGFKEGSWDVAMIDIQLPGRSGVLLLRWLKERDPALRCLVLTVVNDSATVFEALRAGADGYLLKRGDPKHLLTRLGEILAGEIPMSPAIARRFLDHFRGFEPDPRLEKLTATQRRVLQSLAGGASNKELGSLLGISEATVRCHLSAVFRKLKLGSRAEAVAYLHRSRMRPDAN